MAETRGTLLYVGEAAQASPLELFNRSFRLYDAVTSHTTIYDAVDALKAMPLDQLQSIRTIVLEDHLPLIDARENYETLGKNLLAGQPEPHGAMSAVFLAGRIREIYTRWRLPPPPIILGCLEEKNLKKTHLFIQGTIDYWNVTENRLTVISKLSDALSELGLTSKH